MIAVYVIAAVLGLLVAYVIFCLVTLAGEGREGQTW